MLLQVDIFTLVSFKDPFIATYVFTLFSNHIVVKVLSHAHGQLGFHGPAGVSQDKYFILTVHIT